MDNPCVTFDGLFNLYVFAVIIPESSWQHGVFYLFLFRLKIVGTGVRHFIWTPLYPAIVDVGILVGRGKPVGSMIFEQNGPFSEVGGGLNGMAHSAWAYKQSMWLTSLLRMIFGDNNEFSCTIT